MPRAKKTSQPEKPAQDAAPSDKLLGGWMPQGWWGEKLPPKRRTVMQQKADPLKGLTPDLIRDYRERLRWVRAIVNANNKAKANNVIPFSLDTNMPIEGEHYFLILCQLLYRERSIAMHLGEDQHGEDVVEYLVDYWSQAPLTRDDLNYIVEDSSLD